MTTVSVPLEREEEVAVENRGTAAFDGHVPGQVWLRVPDRVARALSGELSRMHSKQPRHWCRKGHEQHVSAEELCNAIAIVTIQRDHLLKRVEEESANAGLQSISNDLATELKKARSTAEERLWRLDSQRARIVELERDAADLRYKIEKAGTATRLRERLEEFERVNLSQYDTIKLLEHDLANAQQAAVLLKESKAEALREEREKALKEECHCGERVREHTCPEAVSKLMNHHFLERSWRPIETAPKDGKAVLLWLGNGYAGAEWHAGCGWETFVGGYGWMSVPPPTHWQPLPEPPK